MGRKSTSLLAAKVRAGGPDRESAKREIRIAVEAHNGVVDEAAKALGLTAKTLARLLVELKLTEEAGKLRERAGLGFNRLRYRREAAKRREKEEAAS